MPEQFFRQVIPSPQPEAGVMGDYRVTHEFYHELRLRTLHEQHCLWYDQVAKQHRRDLQQMRQELNIMRWFCRRR